MYKMKFSYTERSRGRKRLQISFSAESLLSEKVKRACQKLLKIEDPKEQELGFNKLNEIIDEFIEGFASA